VRGNRFRENPVAIRNIRRLHRAAAGLLAFTLIVIATSGLLLGWKKNSNGYIHPDSYHGVTSDLSDWLPFDSLKTIAIQVLRDSVSQDLRSEIERIDARPDKGMVKFVFEHHYHGIQLDAATGKMLHLERRRSDIIEDIHDGSILDKLFGTSGEQIKLVYTTINGIALIIFAITGFLLWLNSGKRSGNRRDPSIGI